MSVLSCSMGGGEEGGMSYDIWREGVGGSDEWMALLVPGAREGALVMVRYWGKGLSYLPVVQTNHLSSTYPSADSFCAWVPARLNTVRKPAHPKMVRRSGFLGALVQNLCCSRASGR